MVFDQLLKWFNSIFSKKKEIKLGLYGSPNTGKTTLANKISMDWIGEPVGKASEVPHETREIQKKEKVLMENNGRRLMLNLLDMPGISTKVDYHEFVKYGISVKRSQDRAKEATKGIIEAIKWLENVDAALVVMDSTDDPLTQVNLTILGNLEARNIPVIIVANKTDLKESNMDRIKDAFPQYSVVGISALNGQNIETLYNTILKRLG